MALKNCEPELFFYALAHCNQGPGKSWKVPEFDKCPGLLVNFKKCLRLLWNSYMRKSITDHLLSFSKYFIMIGFQFVSVIMLVFLSTYLRKRYVDKVDKDFFSFFADLNKTHLD